MRAALVTAGAVGAMFVRTWRTTWRRPVLLTFSLGQPLLWMLFFGFLFHRFPVGLAGVRYLDFLAPGVAVMTVLFGASQSGVSWVRDLQTGFLPRLVATPAHPAAILGGKVLADLVRLVLQAAAVLVLALALGARLEVAARGAATAFAAVVLFAVALCALSSWVALRAEAQEAMATYVHLVNMPLLFTSTALVPHRQMPGWLALVARWNPLSATADAVRAALLPGAPAATPSVLIPLAALAALLFLLAAGALRRVRY